MKRKSSGSNSKRVGFVVIRQGRRGGERCAGEKAGVGSVRGMRKGQSLRTIQGRKEDPKERLISYCLYVIGLAILVLLAAVIPMCIAI